MEMGMAMKNLTGKPDGKLLLLWWVRLGVVSGGLLLILLLLPLGEGAFLSIPPWGGETFFLSQALRGMLLGGLGISVLLLGLVYYPIKFRRLSYRVENGWLTIRCGVIYTRVKAIPLKNIQYTTLAALPLAQWLGLCTLLVHGAGGSIHLPGLSRGEAILLQGFCEGGEG